jgi:hypothetical protein
MGRTHGWNRVHIAAMVVAAVIVDPGLSFADPSDMRAPAIPLWPWPESVVSGPDTSLAATVASTAFDFQVSAAQCTVVACAHACVHCIQ